MRVVLLILGVIVAIAGFSLLGWGIYTAQVPLVSGPPQAGLVAVGVLISDLGFALAGAGVSRRVKG